MSRFWFRSGGSGQDEDVERVREDVTRLLEKAIRLYDDGYEDDVRAAYSYARGYVVDALDDEGEVERILDELDDLWENG